MYYTGIDPFTKQEVYVAKELRDRKDAAGADAILQAGELLRGARGADQAGRTDLIGSGCDCLIPAHPPKEAIEARRRRANKAAHEDHYHSVANPAKGEPVGERGLPNQGYRPSRKSVRRQDKKNKRNGGGSGLS